uniref:hypothetical protein n=1 Tax=Streptomyces sp. S501 TaxID=2420135 RepID=UPI003204B5FA
MTSAGGNPQPGRRVPALSVSEQAHTAGRVKDHGRTVEFSWPGVYFEGRFRGTGLGVVLDCAAADYDVQVDGTTVATLVTPGDTTHWIDGLRDGEHTVRVVRRNDTPGDTSTFGGFVAAPGGTVLGRPAPRTVRSSSSGTPSRWATATSRAPAPAIRSSSGGPPTAM